MHTLHHRILASSAVLIMELAFTAPTQAATFTVIGGYSLHQALLDAAAQPGPDVIDFDASLDGQTQHVYGQLVIDSDVTIDASSLPSGLTLDAGLAFARLFYIKAGMTVSMLGLTLTGGDGIGGFDPPGSFHKGGAIYKEGGGSSLTLTRCTLSNNRTNNGGAIYNAGGPLTLTQCTLSKNRAYAPEDGTVRGGGAIYTSGPLTLTHCTVAGNSTAASGGGILAFLLVPLTLDSCIIAGNTADISGPELYLASGLITMSHSILGQSYGGFLALNGINGNIVGTAANPINAHLYALADKGGPTKTMAIASASPARNAATVSAITSDQRGYPIVGIADIGAYETQIGAIADASMLENGTLGIAVSLGNAGGPFVLESSSPRIVGAGDMIFEGSGTTRNLAITPVSGQFGVTRITVTDLASGDNSSFQLTVERPSLAMSQVSVAVPETAGTVTIPVSRTASSDGTVGVSYTTSIGTATALDYTPTTATLEWQDGQWTQDIIIPITSDMLVEKNETFTVTLSSPIGGIVIGSPASCQVTIIDPSALNPVADTQPPGVVVTSYTFPVGSSVGTILASATTTIGVDSGSSITVSGTATDNQGVKMVEVRVITPGAMPADFTQATLDTAGGTKSKFVGIVTLLKGVNVIEVKSTDFAGRSTTVSRTVKVQRPLLVQVNAGQGSVTTGFAGTTYREVGKSYTIVATPKVTAMGSFIFDGWTVNNASGTGITLVKRELPSLTFTFQEGLVLTANFTFNRFIPGAGSYHGLVSPSPTGPAPSGTVSSVSTEGCFTATLDSKGGFTGKLTLDGAVLPLVGVFDNTGRARFGPDRTTTVSVPRADRPDKSLTVDLQLDFGTPSSPAGPGTAPMMIGLVQQYYRSALIAFSTLDADRSFYDGKTPATTVPDAYLTVSGVGGATKSDGIFSCVIQTKDLAEQLSAFTLNSEFPQGDGFATIKVSKAGLVSFACTLADGSPPVTASAALSKRNKWVLFTPHYAKRGCLSARVTLDASDPESDMSATDLRWFRPVQNTQHYPDGWAEGIKADLRAAKYFVTAGQSVLKAPDGIDPDHLGDTLPAADMDGNASFSFFDVFLELDVTKAVNLSTSDGVIYIGTAGGGVWKLAVTRASGIISGILPPISGTSPKFQGIIYQKGTAAGGYGFYLTPTPKIFDYLGESSSVSLTAAP